MWQLLKRELERKKAKTPQVTDASSKEAFYYASIRNQVIDELLLLPEEMAGLIRTVKGRH